MMKKLFSLLGRFFRGIWRLISWLRVSLANMIFLLVVVVLVLASLREEQLVMQDNSVLVVDPSGAIVEQRNYVDPITQLLDSTAAEAAETVLADIIDAIKLARDDDRIAAILLRLENVEAAGISKMQEIGKALDGFKQSGKRVIAVGDDYTQDQYLLASYADEIYLDPMGGVLLEGYGVYRNYFKRALDKLRIDFHIFRVGEYKSAIEPLERDDMSEQDKLANQQWLQRLWDSYKHEVSIRRKLPPGAITHYINDIDHVLASHNGDSAMAAWQSGLVDGLKNRIEMDNYLVDQFGRDNNESGYPNVDFRTYLSLARLPFNPLQDGKKDAVGVIVAKGMILDGEQAVGNIGGDSLAELIRQAREDDKVRALVLRVDSGGGSAFASEVIRQQLLLTKQHGIPVVVSMGSVAASGGYWIAADADEIWTTPTTLTGSIGIFGVLPNMMRSLDYLGVSTDGVGTTDLSGALRIDRPISPLAISALQQMVENGYQRFITLVSSARNMPVSEVDKIAQGRVWAAEDALQLGLTDQVGFLDDAIQSAAKRAKLKDYRVQNIEPQLSVPEQIMRQLSGQMGAWLADAVPDSRVFSSVLELIKEPLHWATQFNDPKGLYLQCDQCPVP